MKYIFSTIFIFLLFSCEDDTAKPMDNTEHTDTLYADVSGDYNLSFNTNAVNLNEYPTGDTTFKLISGTYIKGPELVYEIYFVFPDAGDEKTNFKLDTLGQFTRFEITLGVIGNYKLSDNVSGTLSLLQNNDDFIEGHFNFTASNIDSNKTVKIDNGYFKYKVFD
jgi:hypothetical protein